MKTQIILNQIKCKNCFDVLISRHRHDFSCCSCDRDTKICIDGGFDYLKRSGSGYIEQSVFDNEDFTVIRSSLYRGTRGKDGNGKLEYILLSNMTDSHLSATIDYINNSGNSSFVYLYLKEQKYRLEHGIEIKECG